MKSGHAGGQGREDRDAASRIDVEDRAGAVPDQHRPVRRERQTAGEAELRGRDLVAPVLEDTIDRAVEAAGDEELALMVEGERGRIDDAGDEGLARAAGSDPEDRHGGLLAARAAVGHVDTAVGVHGGIVHLMEAGRQRRTDVHEERGTRQPRYLDLGPAAGQAGRNLQAQALRRREEHPGRQAADPAELGRGGRDRQGATAHPQPPSLDHAQRIDPVDGRCHCFVYQGNASRHAATNGDTLRRRGERNRGVVVDPNRRRSFARPRNAV